MPNAQLPITNSPYLTLLQETIPAIQIQDTIDVDLSIYSQNDMKRYWSHLLALVLVVVIGLTGCSGSRDQLTGDYQQDTLNIVRVLRSALDSPDDAADKAAVQAEARKKINEFAARYQRNDSVAALGSFTTMRTALNSLAGHYSSYPNRPVPEKLKNRLEKEFKQVEAALRRGA